MANQRGNGKVILSAYVPRELKELFQGRATDQGVTMSQLLTRICVKETGYSAKKNAPKKRRAGR